jgi:hypothetical protein
VSVDRAVEEIAVKGGMTRHGASSPRELANLLQPLIARLAQAEDRLEALSLGATASDYAFFPETCAGAGNSRRRIAARRVQLVCRDRS